MRNNPEKKNIAILENLNHLPQGTAISLINTPLALFVLIEVAPTHRYSIVVERKDKVTDFIDWE